ncbi:glycoside hydrolase family 18 protein [Segetibacter koreensis]|uniref:glycoside hydrolase family 18 protein n=1 Tax=Segetibacter koreensis TaxID=398037 RepID=UPI000370857D|nr:glycoside hydrolase family 18 protein [Segetibacter koreensis]
MNLKAFTFMFLLLLIALTGTTQKTESNKIAVIGYYAGNAESVSAYPVEKLTHIIFSFCHLKGNELSVDNLKDTLTIQRLVSLRERNPSLKVILSLGGWGGCETCSPVFAAKAGRKEFAKSVKKLNKYFKTDGIDLDWEYPSIPGFEGHQYTKDDKQNFTELVKVLRKKLGRKNEISFAAGGFTKFLAESIDWAKVAPMVDKINLMTYDLVNGNSNLTGHHTPLYSTPQQIESTDNAIHYLDSAGVPRNKMIIGAAFYGRIFDVEQDSLNGLYQKGKFNKGVSYKNLNVDSLKNEGFVSYWDDTAKAPYMYSSAKKQLLTFDDEKSIMLKTKYVVDNHLGGIMFWQLGEDKTSNGLLDAIDKALH